MAENYGFSLPNMPAPSVSRSLRMTPEEQERLRQLQTQQMQQPPMQRGSAPYMAPQPAELSARGALDEIAINDATRQRVNDDKWRGGGLALPVAMARNFIGKDKREAGFRDEETQRLTQARALEDETNRRLYSQEQALDLRDRNRDVSDMRYTETGLNTRSDNTINAQNSRSDADRTGRAGVAASNQIAQDDRQNDQQEFLAGSENTKPYFDRNGGVVNVRRDPATGATFTVDRDGVRTPIDTSTLTPYERLPGDPTPRAADRTRAEEVDLSDISAQINASTMGRILSSPVFEEATGTFDPERFLGKNIPTTETGRAVQSLNIDMDDMKVTGVAPILGIMGVNPTDKDMELALETMVSSGDQPRAWIDYVRKKFAPRAREVALMRLASGESTREVTVEEINAAYSALMKLADDSEARLYPDEVAEAAITEGFDPTQKVSDPTRLTPGDRAARRAYIQSLLGN